MSGAPESRTFAIRAGGFSAALFLAVGIYLPFFPIWLTGRGLSEPQIAIVIAAPLFARAVLSPVFAGIADLFGELRRSAVIYSILATLFFAWLAFVEGYGPILILSAAALVFWVAMMPIGDAVILYGVRHKGIDYGRVRLWGSLAFVAGTLLAGESARVLPEGGLFAVQVAAFALGILAALTLPIMADRTTPDQRSGFKDILQNTVLAKSIAASAALTSSHATYYTFGSIFWRDIGYSERLIASLWAYSVLVEIALFYFAKHLVNWGARRFLIAAGIGVIVRWILFPLTTDPIAAMALQTLHGLTFGCAWLGVMMAIGAVAKPGHTARLQAGHQLVSGLFLATAIICIGPLYRLQQDWAFWLMAVLGLAGLSLALTLPRGLQPQNEGSGGSTHEPE